MTEMQGVSCFVLYSSEVEANHLETPFELPGDNTFV